MIDTSGQPDFRFIWPVGSYGRALRDHVTARDWLLRSGLAMDPELVGAIRVLLDERPAPRIIPADAIDSPRWCTEVALWAPERSTRLRVFAIDAPSGVECYGEP